jgi:DNA replication initiation complex subunit (GINS family)
MDEHADMNYKSLRKIQQAEQASATLTKIETDFYQTLSSFIRDLEHSVEQEKNPLKLKLFTDEMGNTKKIANSIYELREKKIVQAALATTRGATPDLRNILEVEKKLYTALVDQITYSRTEIFEPQTKKPQQPPPIPPSAPEKPPRVSNTNPIVRVLEDTPEFIGTDEKTYALRKEDVLSMPNETAGPLLKKGIVKQVK